MSNANIKTSKNVKETAQIAEMFLDKILKGKTQKDSAMIVCLSGDLGAGKTAFTKAIAKYLKIKQKVTSPTFVIIKKYPIKNQKHDFLFHIDAYRLKNEKELLNLGWQEIVSNKKHLVFIEWPENVKKIIPRHARFIYISSEENGQRNLELK